MLESVLSVARQEQVDFIVLSGDIYDRLDITHAERQVLSEWLAGCEIPVIAISGNHEKRSEQVGDTGLSYLAALRDQFSSHIIYDGPPVMVEHLDCYFVLLPYQGWSDQELYMTLQLLLRRPPDYVVADYDKPVIVLMHEAVYGCKTDSGHKLSPKIRIEKDSFPEITYWALGDIHIRQKILDNAWYSGSPYQTEFGTPTDKGVLIVNTDQPREPKFVKVDSIPLLSLSSKPAEGWPGEAEAFVDYVPEGEAIDAMLLPAHVRYNPKVADTLITPSIREEDLTQGIVAGGSIFDGLDNCLARANLKPELYPLAWRIAVRLAKSRGISIELPDRYDEE